MFEINAIKISFKKVTYDRQRAGARHRRVRRPRPPRAGEACAVRGALRSRRAPPRLSSMRSPRESAPRCRMGGHHVRLRGADVPGRRPRPHLPHPESGKRGVCSRLVGPGSAPGTPLVKWVRASPRPDPSAFPAQTDTEVGTPQNHAAPKPPGTRAANQPTGPWRLGPHLLPASERGAAPVHSLHLRTSLLEEARFPPNLFAGVCFFCLFKESFKDCRSVVSDREMLTAWGLACWLPRSDLNISWHCFTQFLFSPDP